MFCWFELVFSWSWAGYKLVMSWFWIRSLLLWTSLGPAHGLFKPSHNQLITSSGPALTNIKKHTWPDYAAFLFFVFQQGRQLLVAFDFHCMKKVLWKSMLAATVWLPTFFKISSFAFHRGKKWLRFETTWGWVNYDNIFIWGELNTLSSWLTIYH